MTNLCQKPTFSASIRLSPDNDYTILYRGRPPSKLVINEWYTQDCVHDDILNNLGYESNTRDDDYDNVLRMIQQMVTDLKIVVLAKRNVISAIKIIQHIIKTIKQRCIINGNEGLSAKERINKMKKNKQLISDLETVINEISFIISYSKSKENITKKIEWISKIKKMKFGQKAMKRVDKYREEELNANNILKQLLSIKQEYYLSNNNKFMLEGNEGVDEGGDEGIDEYEYEYKQDEGSGMMICFHH